MTRRDFLASLAVLAFAPEGRVIRVAHVASEESAIRGAQLGAEEATRTAGLLGARFELTADLDGVVAVVGEANGHGNSVAVIDAATRKVIRTIPVGRRPWGIAVSRNGKRVYTANGLSNDVSVIDTAAGRVVATVKVGEGAWGIAIAP